ncbi:uncharacterized protein LOC119573376 [Penaeus monodon]|uniref:uncharacterized protein LOC119573376 n=1 Tax=Penaeus monodon TaxID=6687 RepID=UPI0018A6E42F|nr:uncharacterized protein LOC119573376 [Penaeus monodon]
MQQCDDSTGTFNSLPGDFSLTQEGGDKMVVTGDFPGNATVEVTIYDPATPTDILSEGVTSCEEKEEEEERKKKEEEEEEEVAFRSSARVCSQGFRSPKDSRSLRVLVVAVGADGAAVEGARLLDFDYKESGTPVWVIVVSVLVSLLVVALVGFGIGFIVKKKKKEKKHDENRRTSEVSLSSLDLRPWEHEHGWRSKREPDPSAMFDPTRTRPLVLPRIAFDRQTSGDSVIETYRYVGRYQNSLL